MYPERLRADCSDIGAAFAPDDGIGFQRALAFDETHPGFGEDRLSQGKMARELGISTATIQHIEDGTSKGPGVLHVCAIADYFSVPIGDFLQKDLSVADELERAITFVREEMTREELVQLRGSVDALRTARRESGHYRRNE